LPQPRLISPEGYTLGALIAMEILKAPLVDGVAFVGWKRTTPRQFVERVTLGPLDFEHVLLVDLMTVTDLCQDIVQAKPGGLLPIMKNGRLGLGCGYGEVPLLDQLFDGLGSIVQPSKGLALGEIAI